MEVATRTELDLTLDPETTPPDRPVPSPDRSVAPPERPVASPERPPASAERAAESVHPEPSLESLEPLEPDFDPFEMPAAPSASFTPAPRPAAASPAAAPEPPELTLLPVEPLPNPSAVAPEAPAAAPPAAARATPAAAPARAPASAPAVRRPTPPSTPAGTSKPAATSLAMAAPVATAARSASPTPPNQPAASQSAAKTSAASTTLAPQAPMDRDFIARNQIVERYLSGKLPIRAATEFERFCKAHPNLLDELGLPERVHAGLRLLEASGKPEPWQEHKRSFLERPQLALALMLAVVGLLVSTAFFAHTSAQRQSRLQALSKQATEQPLDPASSTRTIRLLPSREGASSTPAVFIGGPQAQMADLKIDMSHSPYREFRVTIDRVDQGRVAVINNLMKDSNGHLGIALNSSALGPGNYQMTIEGLTWRGDPEPDSWITIGIKR
jgi:hypothetical protein